MSSGQCYFGKGTASACVEGLTLDRMGLGDDRIHDRIYLHPSSSKASKFKICAIYMLPHVMMGEGREEASITRPFHKGTRRQDESSKRHDADAFTEARHLEAVLLPGHAPDAFAYLVSMGTGPY